MFVSRAGESRASRGQSEGEGEEEGRGGGWGHFSALPEWPEPLSLMEP